MTLENLNEDLLHSILTAPCLRVSDLAAFALVTARFRALIQQWFPELGSYDFSVQIVGDDQGWVNDIICPLVREIQRKPSRRGGFEGKNAYFQIGYEGVYINIIIIIRP